MSWPVRYAARDFDRTSPARTLVSVVVRQHTKMLELVWSNERIETEDGKKQVYSHDLENTDIHTMSRKKITGKKK
jgi:hypothetical protein